MRIIKARKGYDCILSISLINRGVRGYLDVGDCATRSIHFRRRLGSLKAKVVPNMWIMCQDRE